MRLVTASLIGLLVGTPLLAQEPEREREHVVREGDTLWDLADFYFSDPWVWPTIHQANTGVVEDPHWIYPQERLVIPGLRDPRQPGAPVDAATPVAQRPMDRPARTLFYREPAPDAGPSGPTVLTDELARRVPVQPGEFQSAEFLADPSALPVMGRMIRSQRSVARAGRNVRVSGHPKDVVFLSYAGPERPAVGDRLLMVREEQRVREAGRSARVIQPTAVVRVLELNPEVMQAQIEQQFHAVQLDQTVIPLDLYPDFLVEGAEPIEGGGDLEGELITFVNEQPLYGSTERGFISLGTRDGVSPGDIFMAYLPERSARQRSAGEFRRYIEELPPEAVAVLRVLRAGETHATVIVDNVVLPVLEDGIRVRRIRRMP